MYRREFLILALFAVMIAGVVACGTGFLISRLNTTVREVAEITVPDFISTEQLIQRLLENWSKLLLIQQSDKKEERFKLIEEIKLNSTDVPLNAFEKTPNLPEQEAHLQKVLNARRQFVKIREDYFVAVTNDDLATAENLLDHQLISAFYAYRAEAVDLYAVTAEIGRHRAEKVVRVSNTLVIGAGLLSVFAFGVGFLLGFRTLFRSLKWAHILANKPREQAHG